MGATIRIVNNTVKTAADIRVLGLQIYWGSQVKENPSKQILALVTKVSTSIWALLLSKQGTFTPL